jgi:hypothetical protein
MTNTTAPKPAKRCYNHIGGKLGSLLLENFIKKGWIAKGSPEDKHYEITPEGEKGFKKLGIDLAEVK